MTSVLTISLSADLTGLRINDWVLAKGPFGPFFPSIMTLMGKPKFGSIGLLSFLDPFACGKGLPTLPDNYQGVLLGEEVLEEEHGNEEVQPIIHGGIENEVSEDVKELLKLSLKYRVFPEVGRKSGKVEAESRAAKQ